MPNNNVQPPRRLVCGKRTFLYLSELNLRALDMEVKLREAAGRKESGMRPNILNHAMELGLNAEEDPTLPLVTEDALREQLPNGRLKSPTRVSFCPYEKNVHRFNERIAFWEKAGAPVSTASPQLFNRVIEKGFRHMAAERAAGPFRVRPGALSRKSRTVAL